MPDPKVGSATHVVVTRTGQSQQISQQRAEELTKRFYPSVFREDGVERRTSTAVPDNEKPAIAEPGHQEPTTGVRKLDEGAIELLVGGALAEGVSAPRRAQAIKTLLLQDQPAAAVQILEGAHQQGQLGELLTELAGLDGPGTWTTRLAIAANPERLSLVVAKAPSSAYAAALSLLAPHAESDAGYEAVQAMLRAAARDGSLEQLLFRLDSMVCGEVAVRAVLIDAMEVRGDQLSLVLLAASGEPIEDPVKPKEKIEKPTRDELAGDPIRPVSALSPAEVTQVIKAANPETMLTKVQRGLREHPEAAQRALAALATLQSRGLVVVAEGSKAGGVAKEAFWGVISADDYADKYRHGHTHDDVNRAQSDQLAWELTEATRYVDEVLNCVYENGAWRSRTATETVDVLRDRYPQIIAPATDDGKVHFDSRINAPPYEIRGNQLVSSAATFTPAGFARVVAETDLMLTFNEIAKKYDIATYDGMRQLTVRTGSGEVRLEIPLDEARRDGRVYSPDYPDDVRATGADVAAWVAGVARSEPTQNVTYASMRALERAVEPYQAQFRNVLGYAGIELRALEDDRVKMVALQPDGAGRELATLSLTESRANLIAKAERALADFLLTAAPVAQDSVQWTDFDRWLRGRPDYGITASATADAVSWRDESGNVFRVPLGLPDHIRVETDGDILRLTNTVGPFRTSDGFNIIESSELNVALNPGQPATYDFLLGSHPGRFYDLRAKLDALLLDSTTTDVEIAGRTIEAGGPALGGRVRLMSDLSPAHSFVYDPESGDIELGSAWTADQAVATLLDGDLSDDGSIVVQVDYARHGEGVQIWKLDITEGNAQASFEPSCILNTTKAIIPPELDATVTDPAGARAELARVGVTYQPSTRAPSFDEVIAQPTIDGNRLFESLVTVPDSQATRALEALLALDPKRVTPQSQLDTAILHFTVVETVVTLDTPPSGARNQMARAASDAHVQFTAYHNGDARAATRTMRELVRQSMEYDLQGFDVAGARWSIFRDLGNRLLAQQ